MEDIYILINDCISNLSCQFTFHNLSQLSTISKYNSCLIYQLKIHDHDKQPIYYTSTNQIKKFHNIDTLTISKYYSYKNLTELTQIKNIRFYNMQCTDNITKMFHLTSCDLINTEDKKPILVPYFHTHLSRLYVFHNSRKIYNIKDIISFTHLTNINAIKLRNCNDIEQFRGFINLRSLTIRVLKNLSKLSLFQSLHSLTIDCNIDTGYDLLIINHPTITNIKILHCERFEIQNCHELIHLILIDSKTGVFDSNISRLKTLILETNYDFYDEMNINFDINEYINLEYLEYNCTIKNFTYLSSNLIKLHSLNLGCGAKIDVDGTVANNLTFIYLHTCACEFDFNKYTNLKQLILTDTPNINIDKLVQLEYLNLCNLNSQHKILSINCINYQKLTYLSLTNYKIINLNRSNKLNKLMICLANNIDIMNIWNNDLKYLPKLTFLNLHATQIVESEWYSTKILDTSNLSNCLNLKHLGCNFLLNDLSLLININRLNIYYHESYRNILCKLTKLTNLHILLSERIDKIDIRNLKRLNRASTHDFILPEITTIE